MTVVVIDNYDSFTYNLVQYLGELGSDVAVFRNDAVTVDEVAGLSPDRIVLSPGPCTPNEAGICLELVRRLSGATPILGVCLGHQVIGQAFGGEIVPARRLMHGKVSIVSHDGRGIFRGVRNPLAATRYHSLVINPRNIPGCLEVTATSEDGEIMGIRHREFPVWGVQFHPESIFTQDGKTILRNLLEMGDAR